MAAKRKKRSKKKDTYSSPGVYVEEVSSGSKPIEGVGTAVAAFVGFARRSPATTVGTLLVLAAAVAAVARRMRGSAS